MSQEKGFVENVREGLVHWLESIRYKEEQWGRWKYHSEMVRPYSLNASGLAIKLLHRLGELEKVPKDKRDEAVDYIRGCQDPDDGLFRDPLELEGDRTGATTWDQIWGQRNSAAVDALEVLGAPPLYPTVKAHFADLRSVNVRDWSMSLDWSNPWLNGETWARAIMSFLKSSTKETEGEDQVILDEMFGLVEEKLLDSSSGYPTLLGCDNRSVAMAGLFKLMFGYLSAGREIPYAERAIDSTLALQNPNGEFGEERDMCLNWDSLWVLRELDLQLEGGYKHAEITEAGERLVHRLLSDYLKNDGGFAFNAVSALQIHHGIRLCDGEFPVGDILGTIMAVSCLQYCDEWSLKGTSVPKSGVPLLV
ncbi:MAG: hypothetical protein ACQKBT_06910 [Puniceicoccales bacterium]